MPGHSCSCGGLLERQISRIVRCRRQNNGPTRRAPCRLQSRISARACTSQRFWTARALLLSLGHWPVEPLVRSAAKRIFDCACVLPALALLLPVLLVIGLAVRLTSSGSGALSSDAHGTNGRAFTILKFRTMIEAETRRITRLRQPVTQQFTPLGPFLRCLETRSVAVIVECAPGHMSLVGPRPKMPDMFQPIFRAALGSRARQRLLSPARSRCSIGCPSIIWLLLSRVSSSGQEPSGRKLHGKSHVSFRSQAHYGQRVAALGQLSDGGIARDQGIRGGRDASGFPQTSCVRSGGGSYSKPIPVKVDRTGLPNEAYAGRRTICREMRRR